MNLLKPSLRPTTALITTSQQLPVPVSPPPLDELVARFRVTHTGIADGIRTSVSAQVECGRLLGEMKARLKAAKASGYWGDWVKLNCGVEIRQVQRYIKKHGEFVKLSQRLGGDASSMSLLSQGALSKLEPDK